MDCKFFQKCGGCSNLDLSEDNYRQQKSQILSNDLGKLNVAKIDYCWIGARSRRKVILQISPDNKVGFFAKNSKNLVEIDSCYVCDEEISGFILKISNFLKSFEQNVVEKIQITFFDNILDLVLFTKRDLNFAQMAKLTEFAKFEKINISYSFKKNLAPILITKNNAIKLGNDRVLQVGSDVFIQATKAGLDKISAEIREFVLRKNAKKIVDIYAGFGAYSFSICDLDLEISAFEGLQKMTDLMEKNSRDISKTAKIDVQNRDLFSFPISYRELRKFDFAIINPPRNGALPQIKEFANSDLKNIIYVSCNPKTFARDALSLLGSGFEIERITAIDQFFGTDKIELIANFSR